MSRSSAHLRIAFLATMLAIASACILVFTALGIFSYREASDRQLQAALAVQSDLETLLTLHIAANTDFLKGVGDASFRSFAWPVARTGRSAEAYDRLERAFSKDPQDGAAIRRLRRLSASWSQQLENAAHHTVGSGARVAVDSGELLKANETLREIAEGLSAIRTRQEMLVASMQSESQQRLAHERLALSLSAIAAVSLLGYGFVSGHRASLARARAQVVAEEAESRFLQYFEQHPLAMMIYDAHSLVVLTANAAAQRQYGYSREEFFGLSLSQLRPQEDVAGFLTDLHTYQALSPASGSAGLRRHIRSDGTIIFVQVSFHFLSYAGRDACFATAVEVTEHESAKRELHLRGRALDATLNAVLITEPTVHGNVVIYANPAFERITGYAPSEAIGKEMRDISGWERDHAGATVIQNALKANTEGAALLRGYRRDGSLFWNQMHVAPVFNDDGKATHHICVFNDASELVHSQESLRQQAAQDALTLLPNRFALNIAIEQMLERAKTESQSLSLVFVDLDNFKDVNDTLGHSAGDLVLQNAASRLSGGLQGTDVVARYGGDEFVILLYGTHEPEFVERTLEDLRHSISAPLLVNGTALQIEASMGVASYPQDGADAETLLRNADTALYRAKSEGRNRVRRFEPALSRASAERLSLAGRLRSALQRNEFELLYQPKVSVSARCVVGVEALLRWRDPAHGVLSPNQFVRQAEDSGLIVPIGEWIIEQACKQAKQLFGCFPDICVSLNVSPVQFARADLPATVARALRGSRLRPDLLQIEITEGALMDPSKLPLLHAIREMGVTVAIDDFGVGYSSLAYLRHFIADTLKIDMSFVRGIGHSSRDEAIVKAILGLGHTLGMKVVGEGVETVMQRDFLTQHGCDEIQGYLYARPTSAAEIGPLIRSLNASLQVAYGVHG
ncbi:putative bifunctional diguanylate cyclase/phosphodiesterase [Paraburkholderia strydomiana]